MATGPSNLSPRKEQAIAALLTFATIKAAADSVGLGERTLHRWLVEDHAFIAAYHQARRVAFAQAVAQCQRLVPLAISTLGQIMTDKSVPASARVTAAMGVASICRQSIETDELAQRISALEAAAEAQKELRGAA